MYFLSFRSDSSAQQDSLTGDAAYARPAGARRALRALTAVVTVALAATAVTFSSEAHAAGEKDKDALKLHDQAMDEDYLAVEFAKAEKKLKDALKKCGADGCTPKVLGKLHIAMGTVHGANGKLDLAKEEFIAALKVDPEAALNESLTTPELAKTFKEAQKAVGASAKPAVAKPTGEKPTGEKPTGEKPTGEKPTGEKPTGEKPTGEEPEPPAKKPAGDLAHTSPAEQAVNTPVPVYIEIPEDVVVQKVTLRYKPFGGSKWKTIEMKRVGKGYGVEIPCEDVTTTGDIKYFIIAKDDAGDPAGTAGSMKEPYKVPIKNEIDGDSPSLPGKKPPEECAAKEDCPPGLPGCPGSTPGSSRKDGKPWGSSCELTQECKEGLVCLNGSCEEGGSGVDDKPKTKSTKKLNMVGVWGQIDALIISTGDAVCSGTDPSYVCFYQDDPTSQFYGKPEKLAGTNGIQGGFALGGGRAMVSYERQFVENLGLTGGLRLGYAFGGSPTPADGPFKGSEQVEASPFLAVHVEARAAYYIGNTVVEPKKVHPYVFVGGGLAQVNASVPVTVCDTLQDYSDPSPGKAVTQKQGKCATGALRKLDAYQITGLNFIDFGGGATFGITPNFGIAAELKFMLMVPTFGFVIAPSLGPVFAF